MSKESEIMREHIRTHRTVLSMCNEPEDVILNRLLDDFDGKDQRIAELEEQLENAIVPKFKFMKKVYHINKDYFYKKDWFVEELLINGFEYKIDKRKNSLVMWYSTYFDDYKNYKYQEKDLFATKEEAQAKLKEMCKTISL